MDRKMLFGSGMLRALAGMLLVLLVGAVSIAPQAAFAQASPVAKAQQQYDSGKFADALATLQEALSTGAVTGSDAVGARELLGRCQVKAGDVPGARNTFLKILRSDPLYRLDALRTPPDEVEAFQQALKTFEAEQLQASQRIPASIALFGGIGSGSNEDFGKYVAVGGGDKEFDNKPMFGISVRFPLAPRWSLDLEMQRFRAVNEDSVSGPAKATYELTATPMVVNVIYLMRDSDKYRVNLFAGAGPMLNCYASDKFLFFGSIPLKVTDTKVGTYFHAGVEGEYELHPKLAVTGRALFRSAKAEKMFKGSEFGQYTGATIGNRDMDFSGYGLSLGIRGYIGY